ncbi:MAG: glycosyltransferase N-terminal domain-containing protein [Pseudomonadota bacterium]
MGDTSNTEKTGSETGDTRHVTGSRADLQHEARPQMRPEGKLIWCHASDAAHIDVAHRIADRFLQERSDVHLLVTTAKPVQQPSRGSASACYAELPPETNASARAFLEAWSPDICIWTAGDIRPVLLSHAHRLRMPLYLVDAVDTRLSGLGWRWLPNGHRSAFKLFDAIITRDGATEDMLRTKIGVPEMRLSVGGPLWQGSRPMPCNESDRAELSKLLLGRPVWLAAHLARAELAEIIAAHQEIIRLSHRTVLVLAPENPEDMSLATDVLDRNGLRFINWSDGDLPNETTQVILTDDPGELGLWYRVAPISFMGSSLVQGTFGSDPNEPAAHGSAILYGPNVRHYLETYSRFAEVGAARIVRDASTLASAVQRIIPADQSAAMAHAAWDVATQSAAVMDRIIDLIETVLDRRKAT